MIRVPDKSRFPGTGDAGNGIPQNFKTQEQWLNFVKCSATIRMRGSVDQDGFCDRA
jgi:hypothetical protein